MTNREKITELENQEGAELAPILKKYKDKIRPLYQDIYLEDLEKDGWTKGEFYGAGDQYLFTKHGVDIRVYPKDLKGKLSLMRYSYETHIHGSFCDMTELNSYVDRFK